MVRQHATLFSTRKVCVDPDFALLYSAPCDILGLGTLLVCSETSECASVGRTVTERRGYVTLWTIRFSTSYKSR